MDLREVVQRLEFERTGRFIPLEDLVEMPWEEAKDLIRWETIEEVEVLTEESEGT